MEPSQAGPGQDTQTQPRLRTERADSRRHRRGAVMKGFACKEGSASPVTHENQPRETSNNPARLP